MLIKYYAEDDEQPSNGVISFRPALRCSTLVAVRQRCTNEATAGVATRMSDGSYLLQPICRVCAAQTAKIYGIKARQEE